MKKLEFSIRGYDASGNQVPLKVEARSKEQALLVAMSDPLNARYVRFGLVGADGNCHTWRTREGYERRRPEGLGTFASTLQQARGRIPRRDPPPVSSETAGPLVVSVSEMVDVVKKRALPQMSPDPFKVQDIRSYIPEPYRQNWLPSVWPAVMNKLRAEGILLKKGHFLYARNPEWISKKLIEDEPAEEAAPVIVNGHSNGHAIDAPPAPVVSPPIETPTLEEGDKVDLFLVVAGQILLDRRAKKAKLSALQDRLVECFANLDSIRGELETVMKEDEVAPQQFAELMRAVRLPQVASMSQPTSQQVAMAS